MILRYFQFVAGFLQINKRDCEKIITTIYLTVNPP